MRKSGLTTLAVFLGGYIVTISAWAADDGSGYTPGDKLEEVVVTAQKRTETLQNVPISVQVISGDALVQENQTSLNGLSRTIPAVRLNAQGASNEMYIRGIGAGQGVNTDQAVGTFIDDVYEARSRLTSATFLDLDRIEILKGPQSTFFGNNAIAGALNIVTKKPGGTFEASARALYGMFGQYAVEGAVTMPFSEKLSIRAAALFDGQTGWIRDVLSGEHAPDDHNGSGRLTLSYKADDDLDALFKIEGSDNKETGTGIGGQPMQITGCPGSDPAVAANFGPPICSPAGVTPGLPSGLDNNDNIGFPGQGNWLNTGNGILTLNYRQWGETFTSVTAFNQFDFKLHFDGGGLPTPWQTTAEDEHYHQFSQEIRIASATDRPIEYLAGAYFQTDRTANSQAVNIPRINFLASSGPPLDSLGPYLPISISNVYSQNEQTYAVFGSVTWNATDQLKLTAGLRATENHKAAISAQAYGAGTLDYGGFIPDPFAQQTILANVFGSPALATEFTRTDRALLPSATIQYRVSPEVMTYASYSRGELGGGFSVLNGAVVPFSPEYVNAYETGVKSEWLNHTVVVNLDVFRSEYKDLQLTHFVIGTADANGVPTGGSSTIENAAAAISQGVELEAHWAAGRHFRLTANVTYLDSFYSNYPNGPTTVSQQSAVPKPLAQDLTGQPTLYAPKWSGNVTATFSTPAPGDTDFIAELSPYFTSHYFLGGDAADDYALSQDGYTRLDVRLGLHSADGRWAADLIGKNIADRVIKTSFGGVFSAAKEEPRNVAVQLRYRW